MLLVILFVVVALVVFAGVVGYGATRKIRAEYAAQLELIPGRTPVVPLAWIGSHDVEAKLYRRLVAAMKQVRAAGGDDMDLGTRAVQIEHELVVANKLSKYAQGSEAGQGEDSRQAYESATGAESEAELEDLVARFEAIVDRVSNRRHAHADVAGDIALLEERVTLVEQARTDLAGE